MRRGDAIFAICIRAHSTHGIFYINIEVSHIEVILYVITMMMFVININEWRLYCDFTIKKSNDGCELYTKFTGKRYTIYTHKSWQQIKLIAKILVDKKRNATDDTTKWSWRQKSSEVKLDIL